MELTECLSAIVVIMILLPSCSSDQVTGTALADPPLTIGFVIPLSGPAASIGQDIRDGAILSANGLGGDSKIRLVFEDSAGDVAKAVTAFNSLTVKDSPDAYIVATGPEAISPLANELKVPMIATVNTDTIPQMGDYVWRYFIHAQGDAPVIARWAVQHLNITTADVIFRESSWGHNYDEAFSDEIESQGARILRHESYPFAAADVRTSITKIASDRPDAVYIVGLDFEILSVLRQMRELGFPNDTKIIAVGTITTQENIKFQSALVDRIYSSAFCEPLPKDYILKFNGQYSKLPPYFSLFGYDSVRILSQAKDLEATSQGGSLASSIKNLGVFQGLAGNVSFEEDGEMDFPVCPVQIRDDNLWYLDSGKPFLFPEQVIAG